MDKKIKVLIMISTFFPAKNGGGPVVSLLNLAEALKDYFDIYIITDHHDFGSKKPYSEVKELWNKMNGYNVYYIPCGQSTIKHIRSVLNSINPDIVYLNSILDYHYSLPILIYKKINKNIKLLISSRGELCTGAFELKKYKKLPYMTLLEKVGLFKDVSWHVTSDDEKNGVLKYSNANKENIYFASNIPIMSNPCEIDKLKEKGSLKLVFISRIQRKKNIHGAIKILNNINDIKISYDIYGPMEDKDYWNECLELIKDSPDNIKVQYLGKIDHEKVIEILGKYHIFFMPTFSENYGHAIVESMLSGTPVIISDQTPWNNINTEKAGYAIPLYDEAKYREIIRSIGFMDQEEYYNLVKRCVCFINEEIKREKIIQDNKDMFLSVYFNKLI